MNYEDPLSGTRGGQIPTLTPAQRSLASTHYGHMLAGALERVMQRGDKWFTRASLSASAGTMDAVYAGETLGLWKKPDGKSYYTFTNLTRPWMLTALALHDERVRDEQARAKLGERS